MRRVPKKNISSWISDVRGPAGDATGKPARPAPTPYEVSKEPITLHAFSMRRARGGVSPWGKIRWGKIAVLSFFAVMVFGAVVFAFGAARERERIVRQAGESFQEFQSAVSSLPLGGNPGSIPGAVEGEWFTTAAGTAGISDIWSGIQMVFRNTGEAVLHLEKLANHTATFVNDAEALSSDLFSYVFGRRGAELIASLQNLAATLHTIDQEGEYLGKNAQELTALVGTDVSAYLPLGLDLRRVENFLGALVPWLASPEEHRLVILFGNTSELRPAGGFVGSYAEVILKDGNLDRVVVRDVSEADRELVLTTVPPKPLQALVKNWRAADANWFFNFPDSAQAVLYFLESSDLYRDAKVTIDGVIAITPKVPNDLLALTGPLTLSSGVTLDAEQFLRTIQGSVQGSRANEADAPKEILSDFTLVLMEKLAALNKEDQEKIYALVEDWFVKRDAIAFFKEASFQKFFDAYDWTGRIATLPETIPYDYLAVTSANIGGEKTDFVIEQSVNLESRIDADGTVTNHLLLARTHRGNEAKESWYRAPNQSYIKIFAPPATTLTGASGGVKKKITPPLDYMAKGYVPYALVSQIESTALEYVAFPEVEQFEESSRSAFSTWSRVERGKTATLSFDYTRKLLSLPAPGWRYRFIFDKQPGAKSAYSFTIHAPVGYRWRESRASAYEYSTEDLLGRFVVNLTLEKI